MLSRTSSPAAPGSPQSRAAAEVRSYNAPARAQRGHDHGRAAGGSGIERAGGGEVNSAICELLGIDFPLLAFSHCRDVVAAVTNAGGFGVLGAAAYSPEQLDRELTWIDDHVGGRPYGADILVPLKVSGEGLTRSAIAGLIPEGHRDFIASVLGGHGVDAAAAQGGGSTATLGSAS